MRLVVLALAVVFELVSGLTPAHAAGPPPRTVSHRTSQVVDVRYDESASTARGSGSPTGTYAVARTGLPTSRGCRRITGTITGYNILHDPQWSFGMLGQWCWDRGKITYKYSNPDVSSPGPFWTFLGWEGNSSSKGRTGPWIRFRQAHFGQCLPLPGGGTMCGHEAEPWLRFSMYGNGTWEIEHS